MSSALHSTAAGVLASIPSPPVSYFDLGPLRIHFYALCIIAGIIVAVLMTNHRLTKRGAEPWVVIDIAILAVPLAIIGARIFHVLTHPNFYFGEGKNTWNPFEPGSVWAIWEGGIAIFGALIGGAVGAYLGCRWTGIRFWTFADALAPGLLLAQAMGRFGNWFNHELFGLPTSLPAGRILWESIRIDPSEIILGLRSNVWAAIIGVVLGLVILVVQTRRHPGLEPSPYQPGRGRKDVDADVQSQDNPSDFVDVSEPPAEEVAAGATATSAAPPSGDGSR
ncbi:unnamed protein product [Penicillium discolor]